MNTHKEVLEIISKLNQLKDGMGVDGETMQYILGQVGMEWQMLRQLMLTMPMLMTRQATRVCRMD